MLRDSSAQLLIVLCIGTAIGLGVGLTLGMLIGGNAPFSLVASNVILSNGLLVILGALGSTVNIPSSQMLPTTGKSTSQLLSIALAILNGGYCLTNVTLVLRKRHISES